MSENSLDPNPHTPVAPEEDASGEQLDVEAVADAFAGEGESDAVEGAVEPIIAVSAEAAAVEAAPDTSNLRPIGEATWGPMSDSESVIGPDTRIQIQATGSYPWRVHCSLLITANDGSQWIGTGWFIGPKTVVTAGHCVFIHAPGTARHGWVQSIRVMPGRNGATLPYGSVTVPRANLRSVTGWTVNGPDQEYDYGAMVLPTELGNQTGWFGFANYSDDTLKPMTVNISGYPGDKPTGTQWYQSSPIAALGPRKVHYTIDTAGGQSGSAVYVIRDGSRYGVAVHAYGGSSSNSGTRITKPVFDNFQLWKQ
jgi:glutamyl endopeptidase